MVSAALLCLAHARLASSQFAPGVPAAPCPTDPNERQRCFVRKAAAGQYQHVIDEIEATEIGLAPYERYFLGISYFGLSGRTGSASLRCFWTAQAKGHLESFLEDRQKTLKSLGILGNADELKYTYVAAWEHTGVGKAPALHKEPLQFEFVKPTQRSYK